MKEELTPEQALAELERIKKLRHESWRRWYLKHGKSYRQRQKEKRVLNPSE